MKIKTLLISLLFLLKTTVSIGQVETVGEFEYAATELKTVQFVASDASKYFLMLHDDQITILPFPQWNENESGPVGFVSGATPRITAKFTNCPSEVWIKGSTSLELEQGTVEELFFPPMLLTSSGGEVTYGAQNAMIGDFPGMPYVFTAETVRYIEQFEIQWKMCATNSTDENDWVDIGSSSNPVYVTYKKPISANTFYAPYHTVIHLGCKNANGMSASSPSEELALVNEMYQPFLSTTFNVRRVSDNEKLYYYKPPNIDDGACITMDLLLASSDGNGRCGAFAELFYTIIKDQGIPGAQKVGINHAAPITLSSASVVAMETDAIAQFQTPSSDVLFTVGTNVYHFMVKAWSGYSEGAFLPLSNSAMDYDEAKSSPGGMGVSGQGGVTDPRSIFINHLYVKYGGNIFDPSYGKIQVDDLSLYEDNNLEVVSGAIVYRNTINGPKWYFWVEKINTVGLAELVESVVP